MSRRRQLLHGGRKGVPVANVGDIAYYTNGRVRVVAHDAWSASLGTPVGVVAIPSGFAPDNGLARIVALVEYNSLYWSSDRYEDSPLVAHDAVPITDNKGLTANSVDSTGELPSDIYWGDQSYVDPIAKYSNNDWDGIRYIPSPYLGDAPNPAYYAEISGYNNVLSDFDGKGNTDILAALGSSYAAAYTAKNHKATGVEEIEWYLPAMGELGYLLARLKKINESLTQVGATQLTFTYYWSSDEWAQTAFTLDMQYGSCWPENKTAHLYMRPFAQLDF